MVCRLTAGGNRIRTIGPALVKGLSAVADERSRTDKLDGVIKHRSSRETTMVGRRASLDGRLFFGGTDGATLSDLPRPAPRYRRVQRSPLLLADLVRLRGRDQETGQNFGAEPHLPSGGKRSRSGAQLLA